MLADDAVQALLTAGGEAVSTPIGHCPSLALISTNIVELENGKWGKAEGGALWVPFRVSRVVALMESL